MTAYQLIKQILTMCEGLPLDKVHISFRRSNHEASEPVPINAIQEGCFQEDNKTLDTIELMETDHECERD